MAEPTKRAMERAAEKQAIVTAGNALREKYPPDVYEALKTEPDDVLRHARTVIQFCAKYRVSEGEARELNVTLGRPPWPGHPAYPKTDT
ncbi:hypothetical protein [Rhizobium sp. BK176]|uniref:hypothetical protein n=1 Tax=Rhizobium sp. BK176 TaxID=2587071 RepID=UPI002166C3E1|nr:hypothetical protein [Rhizobium sp. BK176]MCS4088574.1 hypothetical protein [Rhizobium sp. BK176]